MRTEGLLDEWVGLNDVMESEKREIEDVLISGLRTVKRREALLGFGSRNPHLVQVLLGKPYLASFGCIVMSSTF